MQTVEEQRKGEEEIQAEGNPKGDDDALVRWLDSDLEYEYGLIGSQQRRSRTSKSVSITLREMAVKKLRKFFNEFRGPWVRVGMRINVPQRYILHTPHVRTRTVRTSLSLPPLVNIHQSKQLYCPELPGLGPILGLNITCSQNSSRAICSSPGSHQIINSLSGKSQSARR
jgi:hypothetical protein